jgi:tRNA A37 threonylcarbamoyladenosine dehydratase
VFGEQAFRRIQNAIVCRCGMRGVGVLEFDLGHCCL